MATLPIIEAPDPPPPTLNPMRQRQRIIFIIMALLLALAPRPRAAELVERIVAVVNNEPITLSELNEAGSAFFTNIMRKVKGQELEAALNRARAQVLDNLIDQRLIDQEAKKYGITVSDEEIDRAVESITRRNGISRAEMLKGLARMNTTEKEYREQIRQKILRTKLVGIEIKSKVVIPDTRIAAYYQEHYVKPAATPVNGYHIQQIGLRWGEHFHAKTKEEARENAKRLLEMLAGGADFAATAKSYSDLPSAEDGGDIGVFAEDEMAPYMRKVVTAMKPGEISGIIETPDSFQILKLIAAKGENAVPPLDQVKEKIRQTLFNEEVEKNYDDWIARLRSQAYIKRDL